MSTFGWLIDTDSFNGIIVVAMVCAFVGLIIRCWLDGIDSRAAACQFGVFWGVTGLFLLGHWMGAL